jgi:tetratricopeptide (TPR) repeat protein
VSFFRKDVIDFALAHETGRHIAEQRAWIEREPANALPYKNLAQLYRIEGREEEALGLLLEAVRLDPAFAEAHVELAQIYAIRCDNRAAWRHARAAEAHGNRGAVGLLKRHAVPES